MELGTLAVGEDVIPVPPPTSPAERNILLEYLTSSIQRSTISFTAFGSLGLEISGVTLDSLINATQSVMAPFIETYQYAVMEMMLSYLDQFREGRFPAVSLEVKGQSPVGERWFVKDFERDDIPRTVLLSVTQPLSLPDTTLARLNAARTAVGDNRQLIPEQAVHEHLLADLVPDHHLALEQMQDDRIRISPQVEAVSTIDNLRRMAEAANNRGDPEQANLILQVIQGTLAAFQEQFAGSQQRTAGIDAQRRAQNGGSITEPSPGQSPPEASGVRPEAVDQGRAGNRSIRSLVERRSRNVNGS
jgi:hypothetical protein